MRRHSRPITTASPHGRSIDNVENTEVWKDYFFSVSGNQLSAWVLASGIDLSSAGVPDGVEVTSVRLESHGGELPISLGLGIGAKPDIDIEGLGETIEDGPGGLVVCNFDNNNAPRKKIILRDFPSDVVLSTNSPKIEVFTEATAGTEITFNGTDNKFASTDLPKEFYVQGFTYSDSVQDIELTLQSADSTASDSVSFTVLWVDQPTVATSGTVSADNDKKDVYKAWTVANTYDLGLQAYDDDFTARLGWGTEAQAAVHPAEFDPNEFPLVTEFHLDKDIQFRDWLGNGVRLVDFRRFKSSIPPGNDTDDPGTRDDDPYPNGVIYDLDAPGLDNTVTFPFGTILRTRNNFKAFASIQIDGMWVRTSPIQTYFVRFSMIQLDSPNGKNWVPIDPPDVPGDNTAGNGWTKLSWNLQ